MYLSTEILHHIFFNITAISDVKAISLTCKRFRDICYTFNPTLYQLVIGRKKLLDMFVHDKSSSFFFHQLGSDIRGKLLISITFPYVFSSVEDIHTIRFKFYFPCYFGGECEIIPTKIEHEQSGISVFVEEKGIRVNICGVEIENKWITSIAIQIQRN